MSKEELYMDQIGVERLKLEIEELRNRLSKKILLIEKILQMAIIQVLLKQIDKMKH